MQLMSFVESKIRRRTFLQGVAAGCASAAWGSVHAAESSFKLRYVVGSSMFGELPLEEILPEVRKTGAEQIDIWPRKHGNQREQIEEMGHDAFEALLARHRVKATVFTHYDLGPFRLKEDLKAMHRFGARLVICGGSGPKGLQGLELKKAVAEFVEKLKPQLDALGEKGVSIGVENHGNNLIDSPDSLRWLAELAPTPNLGIALAPYHLETLGVDAAGMASLIRDLGPRLKMFYAWQHGMGCMTKLPKEQELLQMPGRGELDFLPLLQALRDIRYTGLTEIFMHPVPRGIPILPTAAEVTAEINRSRAHLESLLAKTS